MEIETKSKAELEFDILQETTPGAVALEFKDEILALVEKFMKSGQSGGSAPYVSQIISSVVKSLCMQDIIEGLTGKDDEWADVSKYGDKPTHQNMRLSSVFKDSSTGDAYYLDAIIFEGQNGHSFTGNSVKLKDGRKVSSRQFIQSFPFKPKKFYIDVIETEWADENETEKKEGGGWWTSVVKDESQLIEVEKYYDVRYI